MLRHTKLWGGFFWCFFPDKLCAASQCIPRALPALCCSCFGCGAALVPSSAAIELQFKPHAAEVTTNVCSVQPASDRIFFMLLTASLMVLVTAFKKGGPVVHCRWCRLKLLLLHTVGWGWGNLYPLLYPAENIHLPEIGAV